MLGIIALVLMSALPLQQEIDATAAKGGGVVNVSAGEHLMPGPLNLRSNVELHLDAGAKLVFEDDPKLYPTVLTTWEGVECMNHSPLIRAFGCTNVAITGSGTIAPKMRFWKSWYGRPPAHMAATSNLYEWCSHGVPVENRVVTALEGANVRPHLIQFNRCQGVRLEDFHIDGSPFWTIHLYLSSDIVAKGLDVKARGHNNDGIDIEMSKNVLVENCTFDQGDDAIVIKAGRNQDAWRLNTPSENIEIRNCTVKHGHVLLGVGSEMSGGVRNVWMHDCTLEDECINLFYLKTNERRGGFIENIRMENVKAKNVKKAVVAIETDVLYQWKSFPTYEVKLTPIRDIVARNIQVEDCGRLVNIRGDKRLPVENVTLENVTCEKAYNKNVIENAKGVKIE